MDLVRHPLEWTCLDRRRAMAAIGVGLGTLLSGTAAVGAATSAATEMRRAALRSAARHLKERYVSPSGGAALAAALNARESELVTEAKNDDNTVFAARVSDAMRAIVPDYHLRFFPPGDRVPMRVVRSDGGRTPQRLPDDRRGKPEVDIKLLLSKIGYIRVSPLISTAATTAQVEARMRQIASAAALIYDVRGVPGGDPAMVALLSSYAFDRPTKLVATQVRGENVVQRWTRADRNGPSFASVPVAVLIDSRSASAAEALAFGLKITGRAELFGERSRGAGHSGGVVPLDGGFGLWLPTGRAFDPATGKGWDQVGIEPLHAVPAERALDAARAALIAKIGARKS